MSDYEELVRRYMAIWNEPDAAARRAQISGLWAPDGAHYILDYAMEGPAAIEGRVGRAYVQWVEQQNHVFRATAGTVVGRDNVVKFAWEMVPAQRDEVVSAGFDFLILDGSGRIVADHQFNEPPVHSAERNALADRYLALWNEPDPAARRDAVAELWAADGSLIHDQGEAVGAEAIEQVVAEHRAEYGARDLVVRRSGDADGHRNVVRFSWEPAPGNGGPAGEPVEGFEFLIQDDEGRISRDYRFSATERLVA